MFAKHVLKLKTILTMLLALSLLFVSVSCGTDDDDDDDVQEAGKAYLSLSLTSSDESLSRALSNDGAARDIVPEDDILSLGSLSLTGARAGGAEQTIATGDSLSEFTAALAEKTISTGSWNFTLTAVLNGVTYEGTSGSVQIKVGTNAISITLEEPSGSYYGGISLAISYSGSASRVTAKITSADGSTTVCPEEDLSLATAGKITYTKAQNDAGQRIPSGKYLVTVTFYGGSDQSLLLNTYREYVRIVPGRTSSAQRELDLNEVYTITYYDVDESGSTSVIDGTTVTFASSAPAQFSRRSAFSLPLPAKPGYVFEGWYKDAACTDGNEITQIAKGTVQDMAVYAKWKEVRYAAITDESGVTTAYKDCASLVNAIKTATGNIELVLYDTVTTADLGTAATPDTIINAIQGTGADTLALVVDQNAALALSSSASSLFSGCSKLVSADLRGLDTSSVKSMQYMFRNCSALASIDLTGLDTSSVTNMGYMFFGCSALASIDLTGLDTSKVTTMQYMFSGCSALASVNVTGLVTSSVTSMSNMFSGCSSLASVNVTGLDTSSVTSMDSMFSGCSALASIDLTGLDTSSVTTMYKMFSGCSALASIDLTVLNTSSVTDMGSMFYGCTSLASIDLTGLNASSVTTMQLMFFGCKALASIDLTGLKASSVTTMKKMFSDCSSLASIDLTGLDTSKVTDMGSMFSTCRSLASIDLTGLVTSSVTTMESMFLGCSSLASIDLTVLNTSSVTTMESMFYSCSNLTSVNLAGLNTSKVTDMSYMFYECKALASIDLSGLDTSSVTNMNLMFNGCHKLTSLNLTGLDTSKVAQMSSMFSSCSALTSLDLSGFNTSAVTNMSGMFSSCSALTSLDLSGFNTSAVTNMNYMFSSCRILTTIYVSSSFDTTNVTTSSSMFSNCSALTGGAGTTFDSSVIDKTYARIDGGTAAPGYFTEKILPVILYVSDTTKSPAGNDYSGNGTESAPYATIAKAFAHINEAATADKDWEIRISGSFGGANTIPSDLAAQSLTLVGVNYGVETEGAHDGFWGAEAKNVISLTTAADIPVTLKKIYISGGNPALSVTGSGEVTLEQSGVNGNVQGINISGNADVTVSGSWIAENTGSTNGGGIYKAGSGTLTIKDSTVEKNTASEKGGGVYVAAGSLLLGENGYIGQPEDTSEHGNTALRGGGIYIAGGASLRMEDKSGVICNKANYDSDGGDGGGVYSDGTFTMAGGTINGNIGGGMYNSASGTIFMYGSAVVGDSSKTETATAGAYANKGSGITSQGTVYLGYSDSGTKVPLTGGIYYNGDCGIGLLNGTLFMDSGNLSYNWGRGVYVGSDAYETYGTFTMTGGTIQGNACDGPGGGVYCGYHGRFTMNGGTVSGNTATNGGGVAIANLLSSFTMTDGTISGNTATGNGGGVYIAANTFTMTGGTISANKASGSLETQGGGGVYNEGSMFMYGSAVIGDSTADSTAQSSTGSYSNSASYGAGIYNASSGKCYLGYSSYTNVSNSTPESFDGGVYYNYASKDGGGICNEGSFAMRTGTIGYNYGVSYGGGIQAKNGITITGGVIKGNRAMEGGGLNLKNGSSTLAGTLEITENRATTGGGAIYLYTPYVTTMKGDLYIHGNTASHGKGIYHRSDGTVYFGEGARLAPEDDLYRLYGREKIYIQSNLTAEAPVMTISLKDTDTAGTVLLKGDSQLIADNYKKFALVQPSGGGNWFIDSTGCLQTAATGSISISVPTYTSDDLELTAALSADGSTYDFTAKSGYLSYMWSIDGDIVSTSVNSYSVTTSSLSSGSHTLLLIATDSSGGVHNASTMITVE